MMLQRVRQAICLLKKMTRPYFVPGKAVSVTVEQLRARQTAVARVAVSRILRHLRRGRWGTR